MINDAMLRKCLSHVLKETSIYRRFIMKQEYSGEDFINWGICSDDEKQNNISFNFFLIFDSL